jgi:hypothetical protein
LAEISKVCRWIRESNETDLASLLRLDDGFHRPTLGEDSVGVFKAQDFVML